MSEQESLMVYVWCALFAAVAAGFQVLLELLSEKNELKCFNRRDFARMLVHVGAVAFWGGLSGWTLAAFYPAASAELLGIFAAVLGSAGPKFTRVFLTDLLERVLGVTIMSKQENGD